MSMVKEKPLSIIIEKKERVFSLGYNDISGNITLPNSCNNELMLVFGLLIRSLSHEFLHKWIHENINLKACIMFDNVEKDRDNRYLPESIT